jgi:hypothetical protein
VSDHEDRAAEALVKIADEFQDFRAGAGVEIACRFVGEQDGRIDRESPGDGDALALAAGKLVGEMIEAEAELNEIEQLGGTAFHLLLRPAAEVQRESHIFYAGQARKQVEKLEDEADFVAAEARQIVIGEGGGSGAVDEDFAGCGAVEVRR